MVTVAHLDFYSYTDQDTPWWSPWYERVAPSHDVANGAEWSRRWLCGPRIQLKHGTPD